MKVIISGCGKIGTAILQSLIKEEHDIVVIDTSAEIIESITNRFDVIAICGNGASYDVLVEAGAKSSDLFISVTSSDEYNMLACFVAKKLGVRNTVARIRNSEYNNSGFNYIKNELGISVSVNPELLTAQRLFDVLSLPSATSVENFSASEMEMVEVVVNEDAKIQGVPLYELRKKIPHNFLVCLVEREGKVHIPNGSFTIQSGDKIGLFASKTDANDILKYFGYNKKRAKSVIIVGASKIAFYLSKLLIDAKSSVKVIDVDEQKCLEFSEKLNKATIVNGNGMSQELLTEEGVLSTDALVALTGKDEENVLMSIFAKNKNVQKPLTKETPEEI
jgi:trk system potassium uptake protein TrkA